MQNRLKQLPQNVQKRVYEMAGMAGTIYSDVNSTEYNQAITAFLFATSEELRDFLHDHAKYNLEHRISWYDAMQEVYGTSRQKRVYQEYLRSPEWQRNVKQFSTVRCNPVCQNPLKSMCHSIVTGEGLNL